LLRQVRLMQALMIAQAVVLVALLYQATR
jgi:hypothetical protein